MENDMTCYILLFKEGKSNSKYGFYGINFLVSKIVDIGFIGLAKVTWYVIKR